MSNTLDMEESFGVVTAPQEVRLERILPGPIERVWAYLTESDKRAKWMGAGPMDDFVGGSIETTFSHSNLRGEPTPERFKQYDGATLRGVITHYDPPRKLGFTWSDSESPSEVTFDLSPASKNAPPGSILLVVTHRKLPSRESMVNVSSGWHTHLGVLADELGGGERRPFWSRFIAVEQEYERRIPGLS